MVLRKLVEILKFDTINLFQEVIFFYFLISHLQRGRYRLHEGIFNFEGRRFA